MGQLLFMGHSHAFLLEQVILVEFWINFLLSEKSFLGNKFLSAKIFHNGGLDLSGGEHGLLKVFMYFNSASFLFNEVLLRFMNYLLAFLMDDFLFLLM
jgi:hypothetical protein